MTEVGRYGDDRPYALPDAAGWNRVRDDVVRTALDQTLGALTAKDAADDLAKYYDRSRGYSGTLFLDVEPNDPDTVTAADLYAVTTLSITLDPRHGRLLLDPGDVRSGVRRQLETLEPALAITDLDHGRGGSAETLLHMWELHHRFKTLLADDGNSWVTAAKLCARKRPYLFPVRDNLVCTYLAAGQPLRAGDGWPGDFAIDIQVYAYLMTHRDVRTKLDTLRQKVTSGGARIDVVDLRLLDAVLWMRAARH